ncbi:helicase-related protein [Azospirillum sp. ST 5-10]|uniref:DEAD/DEAH box helicase n=1 Tax=unclassified Azospirillum TaxID=2630922 RepID=UPI003F49C807
MLSSGPALRLRPLTGSEQEVETLIPELETQPVVPAQFDPPTGERPGPREAALLLRDALRLSLRRGAGPFRSAGRINFEPRAYQLAPLMMALRQETVRLLIADDVGIGKTIEAALILQEFLDRGDIDRFAVLCPPHLVEQWTGELESKFSLTATPVTASEAARLERDLPASMSVFEAYPFTVVSLDFIKSERRLNDFLRACPDMVVVDEAHAAVSGARGRHQRFSLLRKLADHPDRHLVMLTATPHSGDEDAFHNLLGLLAPEFAGLRDVAGGEYRTLRERLAGYFIQRRRADIEAWREPGLFPTRETTERKYALSGAVERFYSDVLDYCAELVEAGEGERGRRLAFWGTLALMRCVGSSPAAAARALRTRAIIEDDTAEAEMLAATTLDGEDVTEDDLEPGAAIDDPRLAALVAAADALAAAFHRDPKFLALKEVLEALVKDGFSPVVFCRYIATAEALGTALTRIFKDHTVETVTGALPAEEREARVMALGDEERRILVATDCLSEGVNLQSCFDAVVHYDLSWNPTRHQQREGRVDRFGQKSDTVRTVLLYGENNPVDGAVLDVILRKARAIEKQTGVQVPMPDDGGSLTKALMAAVMLRARQRRQMSLDFGVADTEAAKSIDIAWTNASEREKKARTIFAQRTLKPEEVIPEWEATRRALGGFEDAERFVSRAMMRLGAGLVPAQRGGYAASLHLVPPVLKERFQAEGLLDDTANPKPLRIAFEARPRAGFLSIHRAHPLPGILAESFLETALDRHAGIDGPAVLPRCGVWEADGVEAVTTLLLLRIRHRVDSKGRLGPRFAMAEEAGAVAFSGMTRERMADGDAAFALLEAASADVVGAVRDAQLAKAVAALPGLQPELDAYGAERAAALADDHQRVRQALGSRAAVKVLAVTPVDVIGLYVLMPRL